MPDVRPLASLLKSLSFKSQATLKIDDIGIRVVVEEGRSIQAHAFMAKTCFSTYSFTLSRSSPSPYYAATPPADVRDVESESEQTPPPPRTPSPPASDADGEEDDDVGGGEDGTRRRRRRRGQVPHCEMTISLSTMLECLNIFGNAGVVSTNPFKRDHEGDNLEDGGRKRGRRDEGDEDEGRDGRRGKRGRESGGLAAEEKQTSLRLSYKGIGEPLVMLLEESGIVTRCELTTYEPDGLLDLNFKPEERVQRLIMMSEWLRDALLELPPTSDKLSISFSPPPIEEFYDDEGPLEAEDDRAPLFRLEATGANGSTEMDYSDDKDMLLLFECDAPMRNSYKFSHIQLTKHALANSIKTSIRTDDYGLISFQFMIPLNAKGRLLGGSKDAAIDEANFAYVEFLVSFPLDHLFFDMHDV
ncbi:hypothetical protein JCM11491_004049 [Sporobolomyces phaffii]